MSEEITEINANYFKDSIEDLNGKYKKNIQIIFITKVLLKVKNLKKVQYI